MGGGERMKGERSGAVYIKYPTTKIQIYLHYLLTKKLGLHRELKSHDLSNNTF